MKKITVIGGSGFIGTRFVRRLISKGSFSIGIFDKVPSNTFPDLVALGDVRSLSHLRDSISEGSIIVNLAAEHRDDVSPLSLYEEVNVEGARNICKVAVEKNIHVIIFTSTVAVYGFAPIGTDESGKIEPFNAYGRTKYDAEKIFKSWQSESPQTRVLVIIRPTVVLASRIVVTYITYYLKLHLENSS